jgi:hypothetical protein
VRRGYAVDAVKAEKKHTSQYPPKIRLSKLQRVFIITHWPCVCKRIRVSVLHEFWPLPPDSMIMLTLANGCEASCWAGSATGRHRKGGIPPIPVPEPRFLLSRNCARRPRVTPLWLIWPSTQAHTLPRFGPSCYRPEPMNTPNIAYDITTEYRQESTPLRPRTARRVITTKSRCIPLIRRDSLYVSRRLSIHLTTKLHGTDAVVRRDTLSYHNTTWYAVIAFNPVFMRCYVVCTS